MDNFFLYGGLGFMFFKWVHFLAGITWIGVLYYFNFIQGEWFKEIEDQVKGTAVRTLVPRALWWFRWGAMFTFLSGVAMLLVQGHPDFSLTYNVYIYTGALMGTLMFLNVWLVIWPAQQIVIASSESVANGGEANPEAGNALARAGLASRTNTLFSIPMLFFMGAARGLSADSTSQAALIASTVIILLIEANAIKGKMGPMASVKGVIHCGLALTVVLYCSHCFI
tara:strand:+ start:213 stop:887 length:675 start_codon:yes stop_codon:yes gene_type:complete